MMAEKIVTKYTRTVPQWRPRVTPVDLADATPDQLEALQVTPANTKVSAYVLTLAHDVETLKVRSPLFNAVMYAPGGLARPERELGAIASSLVNHCIYCAAAHAMRHAKLTQDTAVTDDLFLNGEKAHLNPLDRAVFDFGKKLSLCPPAADASDIAALATEGLEATEMLDLILATALFGWANRLMHVLGDPVQDLP